MASSSDTKSAVHAHARSHKGLVALLFILAAAVIEATHLLSRYAYPAEDAAMLMRYSAHLAAGHGITFTIGQHPVDGATDFGSMVLLAVIVETGLSPSNGVIVLDLIAYFTTICVVYGVSRRTVRASVTVSLLAAAAVACGPGLFYAQARFMTPVFACAVSINWALAISAHLRPSRTVFNWFAVAGVITGLVRPEGVIFFGLAALALAIRLAPSWRMELGKSILLLFVPAGAAYFAFHWVYFGYPLPNPFYKKEGINPHALRDTLTFLAEWLGPVLLLYVAVLWKNWREAFFFAVPLGGYSLAWVLLSDETNYLNRFQYPALVVIALSLPSLWETLKADHPNVDSRIVWTVGAVSCVALAGLWVRGYRLADTASAVEAHDGRYAVAVNLSRLPGRPTMAVTEAGLLPFYSGWNALDMWGLNTEAIAHHGLTDADITAANPELVMIHYAPDSTLRGWATMESTVLNWVKAHHYVLSADYQTSPTNAHLYFVRPGTRAREVEQAVRVSTYYMGTSPVPDSAASPLSGDRPTGTNGP